MSMISVVVILFYSAHTGKIEDLASSGIWNQHKSTYNLQLTDSEEVVRRALFFDNLKFIEETNGKNKGFKLAMNKFGHLRPSELTMGFKMRRPLQLSLDNKPTPDLPEKSSIDWRTHGVVTPIKDQGKTCGSCYAFSGVSAIESHLAIKTGHLVVDCSGSEGNNGCDGGYPDNVFKYCIHHGLSLESDNLYTGRSGVCKRQNSKPRFYLSSYVDIPANDEQHLIRTLSSIGPVSVGIDTNSREFMFYESGILRIDGCSKTDVDHAVVVVGYNKAGDQPYYILKNSYGTWWGEKGYFKMAMNENMCGIASIASYPVPKLH